MSETMKVSPSTRRVEKQRRAHRPQLELGSNMRMIDQKSLMISFHRTLSEYHVESYTMDGILIHSLLAFQTGFLFSTKALTPS